MYTPARALSSAAAPDMAYKWFWSARLNTGGPTQTNLGLDPSRNAPSNFPSQAFGPDERESLRLSLLLRRGCETYGD